MEKVNQVFFHYVGKPREFILPALKYGVSRRCPANIAKTMNFGDRVICLKWRGKDIPPAAFAEFLVTSIYFDNSVKVGEKLIEEGYCEYHDYSGDGGGGLQVDRECGSFTISGCYSLKGDVTIQDIFEIAEKQIKEQGGNLNDVWCMLGGNLTKVYKPPLSVIPFPPFMRGFMRVPTGTRIGKETEVAGPLQSQIVVVENYEKKMSELQ